MAASEELACGGAVAGATEATVISGIRVAVGAVSACAPSLVACAVGCGLCARVR